MKSDNKSHPVYPPNRRPNDPYRHTDRPVDDRYENPANGNRANAANSPDYRNNLSQADPNYRDAYTRESLHNRHLARENEALRYQQAVERDRISSRHQAETGRNFLLGILILGLAALGFGIFYYVGRTETEEQPVLQTPVEVPAEPEAESPDINIELPDNPPDVQLPEVNVPEVNVPDVNVQVPEPAGEAEGTAPAPTENQGTDTDATAPAPEPAPANSGASGTNPTNP